MTFSEGTYATNYIVRIFCYFKKYELYFERAVKYSVVERLGEGQHGCQYITSLRQEMFSELRGISTTRSRL